MRNNEIAQSHLTGTACPDKSEFAPAIAPLAAALRSKEDGLQFEAAATLFAIGPINEEAFNALSEIGASNDKDIVRARNQFINYLFVVPCGKTTPAPAPVMPATTAPTEEPTPAPENTGR